VKSPQVFFPINISEPGSFINNVKKNIKNYFKIFLVKYFFRKGLVLKDKGNLSGALYFFKEVIKIDARNVNALNNLGVCCAEMGMHKEALNYFGKACAIRNDVDIIINMIVSAVKAGKKSITNYYCNKLENYIEVLDVDTLFHLAGVMVQGKNYERAIYYYELCQSRDDFFKIIAIQRKGICYAKLGRYEEAKACAELLFSEEKGKKMAWELMGFI